MVKMELKSRPACIRPFLSRPKPLFQSKAMCKASNIVLMQIKLIRKVLHLSLVLKVTVFGPLKPMTTRDVRACCLLVLKNLVNAFF